MQNFDTAETRDTNYNNSWIISWWTLSIDSRLGHQPRTCNPQWKHVQGPTHLGPWMSFNLRELEFCVVGVHLTDLLPCWSSQHLQTDGGAEGQARQSAPRWQDSQCFSLLVIFIFKELLSTAAATFWNFMPKHISAHLSITCQTHLCSTAAGLCSSLLLFFKIIILVIFMCSTFGFLYFLFVLFIILTLL